MTNFIRYFLYSTSVVGAATHKLALLALGILVAQMYGANAFAEFSLAMQTASLLSVYATSGLVPAVYRFMGVHFPDDQSRTRLYLMLALILLLSLFSLQIGLFQLLGAKLNNLFSAPNTDGVTFQYIIFLSIALSCAYIASAILQGMKNHAIVGITWMVSSGLAVGAYAFFMVDNTSKMLFMLGVIYFLQASLLALKIKSLLSSNFSGAFLKATWAELRDALIDILLLSIKLSGYVGLILAGMWLCNVRLSVTGNFREESALFGMAFQCFSVVVFAPSLTTALQVPDMAGLARQPERLWALLKFASLCSMGLAAIACVSILLAAEQICSIYKISSSNHVYTVLILFILAAFLSAASTPFSNMLIALGMGSTLVKIAGLWLVVLLIATELIRDYDTVTIGFGLVLSYLSMTALLLLVARKVLTPQKKRLANA